MTSSVEGEVAQVFTDYVADFNRDDIEACTRHFAIPCTLVTNRGGSGR